VDCGCRAVVNKTKTKAECVALLRKACDVHQSLYRDAMNGRGIDRHIFGLFVVSKGLGCVSSFDDDAM
jgi:Choline/Carnitine o-acyltransferase